MDKIHKFSDFTTSKYLSGDKIKIEDILNKEVIIKDFFIGKSKHNSGNFLKLQVVLDDKTHILNTGSNVLIDQISSDEIKLPFLVKIIKIENYFKFV